MGDVDFRCLINLDGLLAQACLNPLTYGCTKLVRSNFVCMRMPRERLTGSSHS